MSTSSGPGFGGVPVPSSSTSNVLSGSSTSNAASVPPSPGTATSSNLLTSTTPAVTLPPEAGTTTISTTLVQTGVLTPTSAPAGNGTLSGTPSTGNTTNTNGTSSTTTPAQPQIGASNSGVSGGATAGIAIATFVIGLVIGFGIMYIMRRRRKQQPTMAHASPQYTEKQPAVTVLEYALPQPRDDASMKKAVATLFTQIDNHVENFYHGNNVHGEGDIFHPQTRFCAIKKLICEEMMAAIAWDASPDHSLLPFGITTITANMNHTSKTAADETVWSNWRACTGYLLGGSDIQSDRERYEQAISLHVDQLESKLRPLQISAYDQRRRDDLVAICKLAANLGQLVLSQPARWEFLWPSAASRTRPGGGYVYFPAFARKSDDKGRSLDVPLVVVDAAVIQ